MAQVFKKILCPVAFDRNSLAALDLAVVLARQNDALLHAIHVILVPASELGFPEAPYNRLGKIEEENLEKLVRTHIPAGITCKTIVRVGNPVAEIINAADELDADLIVMATSGRTGLQRAVFGSVAEGVLRNSQRPVLAFKPDSLHAPRSSSGGAS